MSSQGRTQATSDENQDGSLLSNSKKSIISLRDIAKIYHLGEVEVRALNGLSLEISDDEFMAIMGPSGSGKSTLLNILGCLDRPSKGEYFLGGEDVSRLSDDQLSERRCRLLGFVFQSYNLLAQLTVLENIQVPLFYQGLAPNKSRERAEYLAEQVGISHRLKHRPVELSGGQQQRVAVARALANDPLVIFADEPTGNLDTASGEEIMGLIGRLHKAGKTIVLVTHDRYVSKFAERTIHLQDGKILSDQTNKGKRNVDS